MINDAQPNPSNSWLRRILFGLFAAQCFLVWTRLWLTERPFGSARWPEGLLLLLAVASTLVALAEELPWQNVLLASVVIAIVSGTTQFLARLAGASFGRLMDSDASWRAPAIWLIAILNARGAARLAMARWRACRFYGSWLFGFAVLLVGFFEFGFRYFDNAAAHLPQDRQAEPIRLEGVPVQGLLWWAVVALPAMALATPSLINKRPVEPPLPHQPLYFWLLLNFLFASAAWLQDRRPEAALLALGYLVPVFLSFPGAPARGCSRCQTVA